MKKKLMIAILLLGILNACAISQPNTVCSPLIIEGKLIVNSDVIVPPCGIIIMPRKDNAGVS